MLGDSITIWSGTFGSTVWPTVIYCRAEIHLCRTHILFGATAKIVGSSDVYTLPGTNLKAERIEN